MIINLFLSPMFFFSLRFYSPKFMTVSFLGKIDHNNNSLTAMTQYYQNLR